ncbi:MAG: excinuclease ABC subunit B [Verrucomicrobiales bacterium]|nr:excinuclease ABC subunit B [Verrucomicrobiales bacterium]|tara:strand:- start:25 stop:525 length:501 start_codon:yes stop_codon:yes gene_type:complete
MLCNVCNENEATVHLTQIVGEKLQKVDLCEGCSKEKGIGDPTGYSLADMLLGLGATEEADEISPDLKCPACKYTQADFKKSGRFGCPECYTVFSEGLESMLKSMHKGLKHVGKTPRTVIAQDSSRKLEKLKAQLDQAVEEENFEEAARLRDEINSLESVPVEDSKA